MADKISAWRHSHSSYLAFLRKTPDKPPPSLVRSITVSVKQTDEAKKENGPVIVKKPTMICRTGGWSNVAALPQGSRSGKYSYNMNSGMRKKIKAKGFTGQTK